MSDFPVNLQPAGKLCLVIGGGSVGLRKARSLLNAGARVRVITTDLPAGEEAAGLEVMQRPYRQGDLAGAWLAFAATGDAEVNRQVAEEARAARIPVNVADTPELCDFTLPACTRRGDLSLSVSTNGRSPALAGVLAEHLETLVGREWEAVLEVAAALRARQLTDPPGPAYNRSILRQMIEAGLPALLAEGRTAEVDALLERYCGPGWTLATLAINLPKGMS